MRNTKDRIAVTVLLPEKTITYIDTERAKLHELYGVHTGRATIVSACANAIEAVGYRIAQAGPSPYHFRDDLIHTLSTPKSDRGTSNE